MTHRPDLSVRRRSLDTAWRATGTAVLVVTMALALAACKDDEAVSATPGGQALIASQPAVAALQVEPPPSIVGIVAPPASGAAADQLAAVNAQLETALDKASACSADTECRAVPVGGRSCGGPTGYRAYSTRTGSATDMDALAQRQRDLSAEAARASHQVSPCFMLADPGARCYQNKCVTGRAAAN
jgi:hypothetical protein